MTVFELNLNATYAQYLELKPALLVHRNLHSLNNLV